MPHQFRLPKDIGEVYKREEVEWPDPAAPAPPRHERQEQAPTPDVQAAKFLLRLERASRDSHAVKYRNLRHQIRELRAALTPPISDAPPDGSCLLCGQHGTFSIWTWATAHVAVGVCDGCRQSKAALAAASPSAPQGDHRVIPVPDVEHPTAVLCYQQSPGMVRCDRAQGHTGRHSWETP